MALLFENIWIWIAFAVFVIICGWGFYSSTNKLKVLSIHFIIALMIMTVGIILVFFVDTDRKIIRHRINDLADAIAQNDVETVVSFIAVDSVTTKMKARFHMKLANIEWTKVRDFSVDSVNYFTSPPTATIRFVGTVHGRAVVFDTPFTVQVRFTEVELIQEDDGQWYVTDNCRFEYPGYNGE